jgi:hypothetical protein
MNCHKHHEFWGEQKGGRVLSHSHICCRCRRSGCCHCCQCCPRSVIVGTSWCMLSTNIECPLTLTLTENPCQASSRRSISLRWVWSLKLWQSTAFGSRELPTWYRNEMLRCGSAPTAVHHELPGGLVGLVMILVWDGRCLSDRASDQFLQYFFLA